jgi:predicted PurR-regulated permease PerM
MENSGVKLLSILALAFGAGYRIGNSSADELKDRIDSILDFFSNYGDKTVNLIKDFLDNTEEMSSDEIKANVEKILTQAVKKIDQVK